MRIRLSSDLEERARSAHTPGIHAGLRSSTARGPEAHALHARRGRCPTCVLYAVGERSRHLRYWPCQARSDAGAALGPARAVSDAARYLRVHPRAQEGAGHASLGLRLAAGRAQRDLCPRWTARPSLAARLQGAGSGPEQEARSREAQPRCLSWVSSTPRPPVPMCRAGRDALLGGADASRELGIRPVVAHCHLGLGKLYRRDSRQQDAQPQLTTVATMFRQMDMRLWPGAGGGAIGGPVLTDSRNWNCR